MMFAVVLEQRNLTDVLVFSSALYSIIHPGVVSEPRYTAGSESQGPIIMSYPAHGDY